MSLTKEQIDRQDFVIDTLHCLLEELAGRQLEYDIEILGEIRDTISQVFAERGIMDEMDFYPWITP